MGLPDKTTVIVFLVVGIITFMMNVLLYRFMKRSRREMAKALDRAIEAAEEWQRVVEACGEGDFPETEKEGANGASG